MPSLKLSNPFRRVEGRPSLKERAASLRATAARVIRRPKPAEPDVDWSNPPAGFMAYPAAEPFGFVNITHYLRVETERLHAIALAEFGRRKEAYEAGPNGMTGAELNGALDRLRRRLRVDELERASNPDQAISNVFVPTDGTILFEDAMDMARRVPVADWISFMASRMYAVAKNEESRAFNEKSVPYQEANRPLEDGLRRDLRLDALHALAFRPDEMFEVGKEYSLGRGPIAISGDDPVFGLIGRHRDAHAAWLPHEETTNNVMGGDPAREKIFADAKEPGEREQAAYDALLTARPTSVSGLAALAEYLPKTVIANGRDDAGADGVRALTSVCAAVLSLMPGGDGLDPVAPVLLPDVSSIALPELRALYDVADLLHELCHALKCQPRCWTYENGDKPAGAFVERLLVQCQEMMAACEDEAEQRKPANPYEVDERLCILARMVIENGDTEQVLAFTRDLSAVA